MRPDLPLSTAADTPETTRLALLPAGLSDMLPPDAAHQARLVERLIARFGGQGYERVAPPLIEYEDSLLGIGSAVTGLSSLAGQTFRLMDPLSQRMMGVRPDITTQIARIAITRLGEYPRPLRLAYAGEVLRATGSQLRPERQFTQIGAELIGSASVEADVEIIRLGAESLIEAGIRGLSVDLNHAPLVQSVLAAYEIPPALNTRLRHALDRKDAEFVARHAGDAATILCGFLAATGPARAAMLILKAMTLPEAAGQHVARLCAVAEALLEVLPDLTVTVDPVENRGFEYHSGVGFALFSAAVTGELGRGGRYLAGAEGMQEPATGFSLFMDSVMRAAPRDAEPNKLFLPFGAPAPIGQGLRHQGWVTLAGLDAVADVTKEATRLGCSHVWLDGNPVPIGEKS
jgi:ATP phosphoribosyltransferase regulatory subunit